jgi:hypothetical protein
MNPKAVIFFLFIINPVVTQNFKELKTRGARIYYAVRHTHDIYPIFLT